MLRYAITDRRLYPGNDAEQRAGLIRQAALLAQEGIDYLQVREKDLTEAELVSLARAMHAKLREHGTYTRLLLNGTPALAQWAGVDGVHLSSTTFAQGMQSHHGLLVSASCHTLADVARAREFADLILFAPVFEKRVASAVVVPGAGLERLTQACTLAGDVPVLALGGMTDDNSQQCVDAGAAGVGGIRMFLRS